LLDNYSNAKIPYFLQQTTTDGKGHFFGSCIQQRLEHTNGVPAPDNTFYSPTAKLIFDICSSANLNHIMNIGRCNLNVTFPSEGVDYSSSPHVDHSYPHHQIIIYLNDADGDTILFDRVYSEGSMDTNLSFEENYTLKEGVRISPKKNRILIFDGKYYHTAEAPKKGLRRILVGSIF